MGVEAFGRILAKVRSGTLSNVVDSNYLLVHPFVIGKSTTGCTVEFSGAIDSGNYYVSWVATDDSSITSGGTGATATYYVPAKPINRLPVISSISDYDYAFITFQSTSGGIPSSYRMSLSALKNYLNS